MYHCEVLTPTDNARECIVCFSEDWKGAVIRLSRSLLSSGGESALRDTKSRFADYAEDGWDLEGCGVYILVGHGQFYVGQADERGTGTGLLNRITEHAKDKNKNFFEYFVLFQNLAWGATELNFFENSLWAYVRSLGMNSAQTQPHLGKIPRSKRSILSAQLPFLQSTISLLGIGMESMKDEYLESQPVNLPKPVEEPKPRAEPTPTDGEVCDYVPACALYLRVGLKYLADNGRLSKDDIEYLLKKSEDRTLQMAGYPVLCDDPDVIEEYKRIAKGWHYYTAEDCLLRVNGVTYYVTTEVMDYHLQNIQSFFDVHNLSKVQVQRLCKATGRKASASEKIVKFFLG